jgi:hypothetical protein
MSARILLTAFMSAAAIAGLSACHTPSAPSVTTTVTAPPTSTTAASATPSSTASIAPNSATAPTSAAPPGAALTRQPCDLLTPEVAKKYVGEDAQRQLAYDANPPVPVGDDACYYTGATREIEVSIFPRPTDPTAPVNHFNVIRPDKRVEALSYEAYWFGPGESIVAVKDGLLISVKVANIKGDWTDQDRADDIELANVVVPRVG